MPALSRGAPGQFASVALSFGPLSQPSHTHHAATAPFVPAGRPRGNLLRGWARAQLAVMLFATVAIAGCASSPSIQLADSGRSLFDGAVYKGETAIVGAPTEGVPAYRVFRQGATGFVPIQSVREDAEGSASAFCQRLGKVMRSLHETVATPPFLLGNFPRVEIVFECADKVSVAAPPSDPKYAKLAELKRLFDTGVLTREEFEAEKARVLSQP